MVYGDQYTLTFNNVPGSGVQCIFGGSGTSSAGPFTADGTTDPNLDAYEQVYITFSYTTTNNPIPQGDPIGTYTQFNNPLELTSDGNGGVLTEGSTYASSSDWVDVGTTITYQAVNLLGSEQFVLAPGNSGQVPVPQPPLQRAPATMTNNWQAAATPH